MLMEVAVTIFFLYSLYFCYENFGYHGQPPGPIRIPPFGSMLQIGHTDKVVYIALQKLAKKYGDVMSIKMGFQNTVILSSYEATKSIFTKDETSDRDLSGFLWDRNLQQNIGLFFSGPAVNEPTRKFCRETLRLFGYGNREAMKNLVLDELTELMKVMECEAKSNAGHCITFHHEYFHRSFLNVMSTLVMGKRMDYQDPQLQKLIHCNHMMVANGTLGAGMMLAFPFLRYICPDMLGFNAQMEGTNGIHSVARTHLHEREKGGYKEKPECFTDHFIKKMEEENEKATGLSSAQEDHFCVMFADIVQAGTDTTSNVVTFTLLLLATYPKIQEKMYQEILSTIGPDAFPGIGNKVMMPYTQAVLLEGMRWSRVVVMGAPRKAITDFKYRKFCIKKGTVIMFNLQSIFFDEEFWGDPEIFRPERFLDEHNALDLKKAERIQIIFGAGKRICFGEALARDSLFMFVVCLIQKFKFSLPPGVKPNLEPVVGMALFPHSYDAIVTVRKGN